MNEVGCFGKVPAHGDFVWQGLPASLVTPWDNWIQSELIRLKEEQPDDWLDTYLCSPMWRFLLRDDALGSETWCGVIAPSVDVVGRYFPITIATALPRFASVVTCASIMRAWQEHAESVILNALTQTTPLEKIMDDVRAHAIPEIAERLEKTTDEPFRWEGVAAADTHWTEELLHKQVRSQYDKPCVWSTINADTQAHHFHITEGFQVFPYLFCRD